MINLLNPLLSDTNVAATFGNQTPIEGLNPFEERSLITNFGDNGRAHFSNANCAIRKAIWTKYPFDEKASFAEDLIWSKMLPSEYKIKYVPDAAVYHSHPLSFDYWAKRYYYTGLVTQYVEHVYGFKYPGQERNYNSKYDGVKNVVGTVWSYFIFFLRRGYLRYIPAFPVYLILKYYYLNKGIKQGKELYTTSKNQI